MNKFDLLEKECKEAMSKHHLKDSYAFESGYYKMKCVSLLKEIEFLQQELESTIEQLKDIARESL